MTRAKAQDSWSCNGRQLSIIILARLWLMQPVVRYSEFTEQFLIWELASLFPTSGEGSCSPTISMSFLSLLNSQTRSWKKWTEQFSRRPMTVPFLRAPGWHRCQSVWSTNGAHLSSTPRNTGPRSYRRKQVTVCPKSLHCPFVSNATKSLLIPPFNFLKITYWPRLLTACTVTPVYAE